MFNQHIEIFEIEASQFVGGNLKAIVEALPFAPVGSVMFVSSHLIAQNSAGLRAA